MATKKSTPADIKGGTKKGAAAKSAATKAGAKPGRSAKAK
jgi:hypothetical protein